MSLAPENTDLSQHNREESKQVFQIQKKGLEEMLA